jgi:hypothetical protein
MGSRWSGSLDRRVRRGEASTTEYTEGEEEYWAAVIPTNGRNLDRWIRGEHPHTKTQRE